MRPFRGEGLTPATHAARTEGRGRPLTDQLRSRGIGEGGTAGIVVVHDAQLRLTDPAVQRMQYRNRKAKKMKGHDHG